MKTDRKYFFFKLIAIVSEKHAPLLKAPTDWESKNEKYSTKPTEVNAGWYNDPIIQES
jgi:hypothetical protein